jgi:hypothetical protein
VAVAASLTLTGGTVNHTGHFTATCSGAVDNAGNHAAPVSVQYDVHYVIIGFLPPLDDDDDDDVADFRDGRVIPLRWRLTDALGGYIVSPSAVKAVQFAANSSCLPGGEGIFVDAQSNRNAGLQLHRFTYRFNWKTKGLADGCYTVMVLFDDGSRKTDIVKLR